MTFWCCGLVPSQERRSLPRLFLLETGSKSSKIFRNDDHDTVLFDNVNSADFILNNRGLLMARNTVHHLSQTTTVLFTYPYYLNGVPVIITLDIEKIWPESDWLRENCIVVALQKGEKFYAQCQEAGCDDCQPKVTPTVLPGNQNDFYQLLHNWAQGQRVRISSEFEVSGPACGAVWKCTVKVGDRSWTGGPAPSKKTARRLVARLAHAALLNS